jgi:hypothetical protein
MSRRGPVYAPTEAIVWYDAEGKQREKYRTGLPVLVTIGTRMYEDDDEVILGTEIEYRPGYQTEETDHVKIPKVLIVARFPLGEFPIFRSIEELKAHLKERHNEAPSAQKE